MYKPTVSQVFWECHPTTYYGTCLLLVGASDFIIIQATSLTLVRTSHHAESFSFTVITLSEYKSEPSSDIA